MTDPSCSPCTERAAETGCPVSKLFKAEITVTAKLEA